MHVAYDTQGMYFKVNLCGNFFVIRSLAETYQKIVVHELGHHFYYYHDNETHDAFTNICWVNTDTKKSSCQSSDFVSDYAQTLSVEDYAEQFMYWFLDLP